MTLTREQALENLGADEVAHRQEAERVWLAMELAWRAYNDAVASGASVEEIKRLSDAHDAAEAAWHAFPTDGDVVRITDDEDDEPARCVLTNCIIHEEDSVLANQDGSKFVLIAALGIDESLFAADDEDDSANDDDAANDDEAA